MDSSVFVDANILIYSDLLNSDFNQTARQQLINLTASGLVLVINNQIIREYLSGMSRVLINANEYDATRLVERTKQIQHQYEVLEETPDTRRQLLRLLSQIKTGGKQVHDANIVATMLCYGIDKLLTNNVADFTRFGELIGIMPLIEETK